MTTPLVTRIARIMAEHEMRRLHLQDVGFGLTRETLELLHEPCAREIAALVDPLDGARAQLETLAQAAGHVA